MFKLLIVRAPGVGATVPYATIEDAEAAFDRLTALAQIRYVGLFEPDGTVTQEYAAFTKGH